MFHPERRDLVIAARCQDQWYQVKGAAQGDSSQSAFLRIESQIGAWTVPRKVFFSFHYADIMNANIVRNEGQDGARATLIEEGVATYVFGIAKDFEFFEGQKSGDLSFSFLKNVRQFVRGYEVDKSPLWLWEEAILQGNRAFRFLRAHRRGTLRVDLEKRSMSIEELPE